MATTKKCSVPGCTFRAPAADLAVWNAHLMGHAMSGGGGGGLVPPPTIHRTMEDFDGMPFSAAQTRLNALGVPNTDISTMATPHAAPAGQVVGHFPAKGMAITGPVQLYYSDGSLAGGGTPSATQRIIPPLKGMKSLAAVTRELWDNDLELDPNSSIMTDHDPALPAGVVSVSPPEGKTVNEKTKVKVVINPDAPAPKLKVPRLRRRLLHDAEVKANSKGFDLTVIYAPTFDPAFREDEVLNQDPDEGDDVESDDTEIQVTVNPPAPPKKEKVSWVEKWFDPAYKIGNKS